VAFLFFADITPTMRYRRLDLTAIKAANKNGPRRGERHDRIHAT
jgi:hypothetical protein